MSAPRQAEGPSMRPGGIGALCTIGTLHEMDEDAARGLRVQERDLRAPRAGTRRLVDDGEARGLGVTHSLFDVGDAERDVMEALAAPRDEPRDVALVDHLLVAVGHAVLEDLEVGVAHAREGRAEPSVGVLLFHIMDLEAELVAEDLDVLPEVPRRDADVVDAENAQ